MLFQIEGKHVCGLPVALYLPCTIRAYDDHFDFFCGATHVSLANDRITDVCIKQDRVGISSLTSYLIVNYVNSKGNLTYLSFDVTACANKACKFIREYSKTHAKTVTNVSL